MKLLTAGIATLLLIVGCATSPPVGAPAPEFSATDATGSTVSLASYDDGVLILDFWAVW